MNPPFPTVIIENITPKIEGENFPIKRISGELVTVQATIFKEGHDRLRAFLKWRSSGATAWNEAEMMAMDNHRWQGSFKVTSVGMMEYTIEAWGDAFDSWLDEVEKKLTAILVTNQNQDFSTLKLLPLARRKSEALCKHNASSDNDARDNKGKQKTLTFISDEYNITNLSSEALEGSALLHAASGRAGKNSDAKKILLAALTLEKECCEALQNLLTNRELLALVKKYPDRSWASSYEPFQKIRVDRPRATFSTWYEFFPRSAEGKANVGSTFRDCLPRIDDAKAMGFDVIYFPPIHPIGITARKGRNNSLHSRAEDPGVPYAIGAETGGHYAVEPSLGTLEDFDWLLKEIHARDMELALDFALNCSPDHPYVKEHPEWFFHRADGSIKHAENPPKKYEDVFPLNFHTSSWRALWEEMRNILLFWAKRGVRIFRVDNPHTKPVAFWEWVIAEIQSQFPDVIFLSEAFTHPAMMKRLAKIGFSQSYTYFTWRNRREELEEYFTKLTKTEMKEYFRPHLFPNTPDILPFHLQEGGRSIFLIRAILAATLSSLYGIYSGFELCENQALPGREEYADSEKYQFKERDWNAPGNIKPWITRLNKIRKENPALQRTHLLTFCGSDNRSIIFYHKKSEDETNHLFIAVNLDPHHTQSGMVQMPLEALQEIGLTTESCYKVEDLLTGECYNWQGLSNFVSLHPEKFPAHIFRIRR
ncbi:MAG: alpha-1,4-glucan--maltose-1-phosphate maltosyltransferase [Chthoniobacterales bacterium]